MALIAQPAAELAGQRRLAGTLQAGQHDHRRRVLGELQPAGLAAEDRDELLVDDLDDLLGRVQRPRDLFAQRARLDRGDELAHDRQGDVGLEQGDANLARNRVDIGLGEAAFAAQSGEDGREPVSEGVEHALQPTGRPGRRLPEWRRVIARCPPPAPIAPIVVVVMGVSGTGKSTVAAALVRDLGWPFAEGDDFHSAANIAKMHAGHPLTDADRRPWLEAIAAWIGEREAAGTGGIVTCSALKRSYRDLLRRGHPDVRFLCLTGSRECSNRGSSTASATSCRPRCSTANSPPSSHCSPTSRGARSTSAGRRKKSSGAGPGRRAGDVSRQRGRTGDRRRRPPPAESTPEHQLTRSGEPPDRACEASRDRAGREQRRQGQDRRQPQRVGAEQVRQQRHQRADRERQHRAAGRHERARQRRADRRRAPRGRGSPAPAPDHGRVAATPQRPAAASTPRAM